MSTARFKELINHDIRILLPKSSQNLKKLGKDHMLPDISPREHRLFIQKPSLARNSHRPKDDMQVVKDAIEKTLSRARAHQYELQDMTKDISGKRIKYDLGKKKSKKNVEMQRKITTFKRFISSKPIKSRETRRKSPIFHEETLMILNRQKVYTPVYSNEIETNREIEFSQVSRGSSESDEDKLKCKLQQAYLDMYEAKG